MFIPYYVSCVMCHVLRITCHVSPVTCHLSSVKIFFIPKKFLQSGGASSWRVCYQRGLPYLVLIDSWIHSVTYSSKYSSTKLYSKTARARELKLLEKVNLPPHDMCQVSHVRCHVSCVTCHMSCVICHMSHVTCLGGRRTMRGTPGRQPHMPYHIPNIPYQIWKSMSF